MVSTEVIEKLILPFMIALITSQAFFSFLQFWLQRRDNKKGLEKELKKTNEKIDNVKIKFDKRIDETNDKIDRNQAILARTHILRFADEQKQYCTVGISHSKEYFEQQLDDITTYTEYCEEHPKFKNERTVMSSEYIKDEYKRLYLNND